MDNKATKRSQAEEENKPELVFDSRNISRKAETEYFSQIEGSANRKRRARAKFLHALKKQKQIDRVAANQQAFENAAAERESRTRSRQVAKESRAARRAELSLQREKERLRDSVEQARRENKKRRSRKEKIRATLIIIRTALSGVGHKFFVRRRKAVITIIILITVTGAAVACVIRKKALFDPQSDTGQDTQEEKSPFVPPDNDTPEENALRFHEEAREQFLAKDKDVGELNELFEKKISETPKPAYLIIEYINFVWYDVGDFNLALDIANRFEPLILTDKEKADYYAAISEVCWSYGDESLAGAYEAKMSEYIEPNYEVIKQDD